MQREIVLHVRKYREKCRFISVMRGSKLPGKAKIWIVTIFKHNIIQP